MDHPASGPYIDLPLVAERADTTDDDVAGAAAVSQEPDRNA
jgi:hypothetical protein